MYNKINIGMNKLIVVKIRPILFRRKKIDWYELKNAPLRVSR